MTGTDDHMSTTQEDWETAYQVDDLRALKLSQATEFFTHLGERDIRFLGVSGSVSYVPSDNDDVDIFIICEKNRLWKVLCRAFLLRRRLHLKDICLSLTIDEGYASEIFRRDAEYVVASDSVHVIPLYGSEYYRSLLAGSPFIRRYFPQVSESAVSAEVNVKEVFHPSNFVFFFILAPYLLIKSWRECRRLCHTDPDRRFDVRIGLNHFFLDTVKYNRLKEELSGGVK